MSINNLAQSFLKQEQAKHNMQQLVLNEYEKSMKFCVSVSHLFIPYFINNAFLNSTGCNLITACSEVMKDHLEKVFKALGLDTSLETCSNEKGSLYIFSLNSKTISEPSIPDIELSEDLKFINKHLNRQCKSPSKEYINTFIFLKHPVYSRLHIDFDLPSGYTLYPIESYILSNSNHGICVDYSDVSKFLLEQSFYQLARPDIYIKCDDEYYNNNKFIIYSSVLALLGHNISVVKSIKTIPGNDDIDLQGRPESEDRDVPSISIERLNSKVSDIIVEKAKRNILSLNIFSESELEEILKIAKEGKSDRIHKSFSNLTDKAGFVFSIESLNLSNIDDSFPYTNKKRSNNFFTGYSSTQTSKEDEEKKKELKNGLVLGGSVLLITLACIMFL
jgi:galactitol-specific phosphotransferase system IIB component